MGKLRSEISLELQSRGLVSGSREFKNAYQRELRAKTPGYKEIQKLKWKEWYQKKKTESNGEWNRSRITAWRKANPEKWKALALRASKKDVHRRFYANNRDRVKEQKREDARRKRREDPLFGIWQELRSGDVERVSIAIKKLGDAINGID